jgi:hypothetical protein
MYMTKARRLQLIRMWTVLVLTSGATIGLEIMLLGDRALIAVALTFTAALVIGIHLTRRTLAHPKRAGITVGDLRGRPRPVRRGA